MLKKSLALLLFSGVAAAQTSFTAGPGLALAVPDNAYNGNTASMACHTLNVPSFGTVDDVSVQVAMSHSYVGDLTIKLISPASTVATLVSRPGVIETVDDGSDTAGFGESANLAIANPLTYVQTAPTESEQMGKVPVDMGTNDTICLFAGSPCSYNPDNGAATSSEDLSTAFDGQSGTGNWQLCIGDSGPADLGSLDGWTLTLTGTSSADLSITKTDGVASVNAGGTATYTITASNAGPNAATGATVADTFPAACVSPTWTCVGAGGGTCTAGGSGNINDAVNLPSGGSVTYTATCPVSSGASGSLANTATVTAPGGTTDPNTGNNSATDTDTINSIAAPQFSYTPAAGSAVNFTGGTLEGSTGNASIAVTIGTPGLGTGASATTTTTCTAPTAPFSGFGQSVTAEGAAASTTGGPLSGSCVLGASQVVQTLTCSENRGGTPTTITFDLTCPAGTAAALTSTPVSGSTVTLPSQIIGTGATNSTISFQNPGLVPATVTCVAPAAPFTANPLTINVPAGGSASTTVSFNSATAGAFAGTLTCSAGQQQFTFALAGTANAPSVPVPAMNDYTRLLLVISALLMGMVTLGLRARRG